MTTTILLDGYYDSLLMDVDVDAGRITWRPARGSHPNHAARMRTWQVGPDGATLPEVVARATAHAIHMGYGQGIHAAP